MKVHYINPITTGNAQNTNRIRSSISKMERTKSMTRIEVDRSFVNIRNPEYNNSENYIKRLSIGDGKQLHIGLLAKDSAISARFVESDGSNVVIEKENCPRELHKITTKEMLNKFLENTSVRISILSDGAPKLYISQKCFGGGGENSTAGGGGGSWVNGAGKTVVGPDGVCPPDTHGVCWPSKGNCGSKECNPNVKRDSSSFNHNSLSYANSQVNYSGDGSGKISKTAVGERNGHKYSGR